MQESGKLYIYIFVSLDCSRRRWLFYWNKQEPSASPGRKVWRVGRVVLGGGLRLKFDSTGVLDRLVGDGKTE